MNVYLWYNKIYDKTSEAVLLVSATPTFFKKYQVDAMGKWNLIRVFTFLAIKAPHSSAHKRLFTKTI